MSLPLESIPVLTDVFEETPDEAARAPVVLSLEELEAHLTAAVHQQTDELVHNACREMEALMLEQVSDRLKSQLPTLVSRIILEHFKVPDPNN
jgi:hypothetical protein